MLEKMEIKKKCDTGKVHEFPFATTLNNASLEHTKTYFL
jgi:hypothetical protein